MPPGIYSHKDPKKGPRKGRCDLIQEGVQAPDFATVDHTGKEVKLSDLRGKKVWLWFYTSPGGGN